MIHTKHNQSGFTLIEMIVSLGLFSVVITIAIGAFLSLVAGNEQLQSEQNVMINITFALDSMTREIRTGTHYYCNTRPNYSAGGPNNIFDNGNDLDAILDDETADCSAGRSPSSHDLQGLAFKEGGDSITGSGNERIVYFFDRDEGTIYRRVGSGDRQSIVSSGIVIEDMEFYVSGSNPLSSGSGNIVDQPVVTIYIKAHEDRNNAKSYDIQTSITQRTLDI
jgi:prepilin-type N-terminal cleavage/methylation domain-containing protein